MDNKARFYIFLGLLAIGFLLLVGKLFELQLVFGSKNRALAEGNRIKKEVIPAPRGIIYDRYDKELVRNVPIYRLKTEENCEDEEGCFKFISRDEALNLEAQGELDGLRTDIGRDYLYREALAHVLGYLGEANKEEVELGKYQMGDLVGRMGVEEKYDRLLRGQDGGLIYEVDAYGNKIREIGRFEPIPGNDLYLLIDAELSKKTYAALEGKPGAVVVSKVENNEILALVSSPSFDPNLLSRTENKDEKSQEKIKDLFKDPLKPFFNRAITGVYPPGSTFKIVTATAGIEEGKVDEDTIYNDTGQIQIGEYVYRNWYFTQYGKTEGEIDLIMAIKRSTDTFFYKIGEWVGATRLSEWAYAFGLGKKTGIKIPGEVAGFVPTPKEKQRLKGERWFLGNTYHYAIGQGDLLTTPLQINNLTNIIASGGELCNPSLLEDEEVNCQSLRLKDLSLKLVKEGMKEACSPKGTAFPFFDFKPQVACKTGTAEFGDPEGETHAWLTAFAPFDKPDIVATALIEKGGEGSDVAAPVVKEIMNYYFHER